MNEFRRPVVDIIGIVLMALGLIFVLAGWLGMRDQQSVVEQLPYLASGGVGGLAFIGVGAALLHLTRQARIEEELRELASRQEAMEEAVERFILAMNNAVELEVPLVDTSPSGRRASPGNGSASTDLPKLRGDGADGQAAPKPARKKPARAKKP